MKLRYMMVGLGAAALMLRIATPAWAAEEQDEVVTMSQVPEAVQQAIKKYASESEIKKIEKGDVDGEMAYEFEIEKGTKKSEVTLLPSGKLLGTEEVVELSEVPEPARNAISEKAQGGKLISVEKVFEKGKTGFEAVVEKDGKKTEFAFTPKGKLVGTEEVKDSKAKEADEKKEGKEKE